MKLTNCGWYKSSNSVQMGNAKSVLFLFFIILSCISCNKEETNNPPIGVCPTINDVISWKSTDLSYGTWRIGKSGFDGNFGIPTGGSVVINLRKDCGWNYYGNETGGVGNTYAVYNFDTAVIFRWANGNLHEIIVSAKWRGFTYESIKAGDLLSKFLAYYPEFHVTNDSAVYISEYSNGKVTACFTNNSKDTGKLKSIKVSGL